MLDFALGAQMFVHTEVAESFREDFTCGVLRTLTSPPPRKPANQDGRFE